jgi:hypothetical protein
LAAALHRSHERSSVSSRAWGVVCDIVVPDGIRLAMGGVLSPGERAALALFAGAERKKRCRPQVNRIWSGRSSTSSDGNRDPWRVFCCI